MNNKTQSSSGQHGQQASGQIQSGRLLRLGLDVHYRQVTVALQEDGGRIQVAGKMGYEAFGRWMEKKLAAGWQIQSCYEAGACGYWLHRMLEQKGVPNLVVAPKAMGQSGMRQKTDRRDSVELVDALERFARGQKKALSPVAVPRLEQEQKRALIRFHRQMMADRGRAEARGKGLLCAQGLEVRGCWWQNSNWQELLGDRRLKDWVKEQLVFWRQQILRTEAEQKALRRRIEALAPVGMRPKGVGAYSSAVLEYEMKGWARFTNRRQVASYTGLCPGIHSSNGRGKEGSINRCGNAEVRWTLVEMVWRLMIWQPQYEPVRVLAASILQSKRAKRRLVVKAARRLAIDLWRLQTGRTTAEKLSLELQKG
jgi:transposase